MANRLSEMKERSQKRKEVFAKFYGLENPESLKSVLKVHDEQDTVSTAKKDKLSIGSGQSAFSSVISSEASGSSNSINRNKESDETGNPNVKTIEDFETEELYTDSSAFLKGTQSENPHNDYCQHFVDTGERPQNFIRDVGLANRFEEYPKQRELIRLKDELIAGSNAPPMYLQADLETFNLHELDCKFDVILIEPPFEEYQRTHGAVFDKYWDWDEIEALDIPSLAAQRSFLWIWCGNAGGLERGRRCLKEWGFRRCEDICWIKTNLKHPGHNKNLEPDAIFQRSKEHCLMGIKGTVKRNTDGDFIHANVDIDLIIDEQPEYGSKEKPIEMFHIIEHFCLGRRRLHLFARDSTIRPGWLSVGPGLTSSNFDGDLYKSFFSNTSESYLTGCTEDIERLRPKSPNPKSSGGDRGGRGGRGRGGPSGQANSGSRGGNRGGQGRGNSAGRGGAPSRGGGGFRGGGRGGRGGLRDDFRGNMR